MPYVYSTKSSATAYTFYDSVASGMRIRKIVIKGGANLANSHFITPKGIATKVTDEELSQLETHPIFKNHVSRGFLTVEKKEHNADKIAKNLTSSDGTAPLTPAKIAEAQKKKTEALEAAAKNQ